MVLPVRQAVFIGEETGTPRKKKLARLIYEVVESGPQSRCTGGGFPHCRDRVIVFRT